MQTSKEMFINIKFLISSLQRYASFR